MRELRRAVTCAALDKMFRRHFYYQGHHYHRWSEATIPLGDAIKNALEGISLDYCEETGGRTTTVKDACYDIVCAVWRDALEICGEWLTDKEEEFRLWVEYLYPFGPDELEGLYEQQEADGSHGHSCVCVDCRCLGMYDCYEMER